MTDGFGQIGILQFDVRRLDGAALDLVTRIAEALSIPAVAGE